MTDRVTIHEIAESLSVALGVVPAFLRQRIQPRLFTTDPVWAGISNYEDIEDGRSYRNTMHVLYPCHYGGPTIIVAPEPEPPVILLHELGHVVDEQLGFAIEAPTTTPYSQTNCREAFAEAFTLWLISRLPENSIPGCWNSHYKPYTQYNLSNFICQIV